MLKPPKMNWTSEQVEEIERYYKVLTSEEIATGLGVKPPAVRKLLSNHGIKAPKGKAEARRRADELLRRSAKKFHVRFRWTYHDIAEQMELPTWYVTDLIQWLGGVQGELWPLEWYTVTPKMRAVHVRRRAVKRWHQLELFDELQMTIAA